MSTFEYTIEPIMGNTRIVWTAPQSVRTADACKAFCDAIRDKGLIDGGGVSTKAQEEASATVFLFCLPKILRDNPPDADKAIKSLFENQQAA